MESGKSSSWTGGGGVMARRIGPVDTIVVPEKAIGGGVVRKNLLAVAQIAQSAAFSAAVAGL